MKEKETTDKRRAAAEERDCSNGKGKRDKARLLRICLARRRVSTGVEEEGRAEREEQSKREKD